MSSKSDAIPNPMQTVTRKPQYVFFLFLVIAWLVQRFVPGLLLGYALLGVAGAFLSIYLLSSVLHGATENILVAWGLVFPPGYYFLSFPRDNPSITLDRLVVGVLLAGMLFAGRTRAASTPVPL